MAGPRMAVGRPSSMPVPAASTGSPAHGVIVDPSLAMPGAPSGPQLLSPAPQAAASGAAAPVSAVVGRAHVQRLARLAVELEAQIAGGCDAAAIRLVRQRLTQWIEDLRSVGGSRELAEAVAALVRRLSDALAAPINLAAELAAIADELARLATGAVPPDTGSKPSRPPFWK
jgi:hypothetical protein